MNRFFILVFLILGSLSLNAQTYKNYFSTGVFIDSQPDDAQFILIGTPSSTTSLTFTLPADDGSNNQVLASDANGILFWTTLETSSDPGTPDKAVQFNLDGFSGSSLFVWDYNNNYLGINNSSPSYNVDLNSNIRVGGDGVDGALYFTRNNNDLVIDLGNGLNEDQTYVWPENGGEQYEALVTDGSGNLSWGGQIAVGPTTEGPPDADNDISGDSDDSYVGGGDNNDIDDNSDQSSIFGGDNNDIDDGSDNAVIFAGDDNFIDDGSDNSMIGGGTDNKIDDGSAFSIIFGGDDNFLVDGVDDNGAGYSFIGGGDNNGVAEGDDYNVIMGGENNEMTDEGEYNIIVGGFNHGMDGTNYSGVLLNFDDAGGNTHMESDWSVMLGTVDFNPVSGDYNFFGVGQSGDVNGDNSAVINSDNNDLTGGGSDNSVIIYGEDNDVNDNNAFAGGDASVATGAYSIALGNDVGALFDGSIIFGDNSFDERSTSTTNEWMMRFDNGYKLYTDADATVGVEALGGASSWSSISDSNKKWNILELDQDIILNKINSLNIYTWNYRGNPMEQRSYGPMFQEFHKLFGKDEIGLFHANKAIKSLDLASILIVGVQESSLQQNKLIEEINSIKKSNTSSLNKLNEIEKRLNNLK